MSVVVFCGTAQFIAPVTAGFGFAKKLFWRIAWLSGLAGAKPPKECTLIIFVERLRV
jgi:hypothetical protein